MAYVLKDVERVSNMDSDTFSEKYYKPRRPVIIEDFAEAWPAVRKWNYDYFKTMAGQKKVALYDDSKADYNKKVNEPALTMLFADYLDLIRNEPTKLRIFLFNIFREIPELCKDFRAPALAPDVLTKFPMMFFGGRGSSVFLHFDIDLSHVYHTHFGGEKQAILFDYGYKDLLYRLPYSVHNIENIDIENPDTSQWPAMSRAEGYKARLNHGETLFMPSGMWHYMKYVDSGFSLSLRALDRSFFTKIKGLYNISVMRQIDNIGRKLGGAEWMKYKEKTAVRKAEKALDTLLRGTGSTGFF